MNMETLYHKIEVSQYTEALLQTEGRKVCTNMAKTLMISHDFIYRDFLDAPESIESIRKNIFLLANEYLSAEKSYLLIDDAKLMKLYSSQIEGVEYGFDGSSGLKCNGITMVNAMLSDNNLNIPIHSLPYVSKELLQNRYKTKSALAIDLISMIKKQLNFDRTIADAHYATKDFLIFLYAYAINFLMKIARSRIVTIGGVKGKLKDLLRLRKNSRVAHASGEIGGLQAHFYVVKLPNKNTVYLISNDEIAISEVALLYKMRWKIEIFHRTAKQYFGLKDCQMRAIEKQQLHAINVMQAYAVAAIQAKRHHFDCVEDYIKHYRDVKMRDRIIGLEALGKVSHAVA